MAEWGESNGCVTTMICEHHASPDGYLPSPMVLAAAIAARTTHVPIVVGALLLNFYDPIKLAEDMAVLDIVSNGRVSYVIGLGYRPEEYAMFGVDMATRGKVMDQKLDALRRALAGERFVYEGRQVHVTPAPGHARRPDARPTAGTRSPPPAAPGGSGLDMFAEGGDRRARRGLQGGSRSRPGVTPGNAYVPTTGTGHVRVRRRGRRRGVGQLGPHLLHDARMYDEWMGDEHDAGEPQRGHGRSRSCAPRTAPTGS